MKRPPVEYALIVFGFVIFVLSLITAIQDIGSFWVSALCSLLLLLPFCLPWERSGHRFLFLGSLLLPLLCCWIGVPQLLIIHRALQNGSDVFSGLPFSIYLGFLNMHLLVLGTLLVTLYALIQTFGGSKRSVPLSGGQA